jgi:hypothetical protein
MKWFRFYTETLDDIKILQLTDYEYRMWTYLMAYACEVDSESGDCKTNVTSLSIRCRTRVSHLKHAIETFQKLGIVSINESGNIVITNWSKRQFKSDNVYERVKKHREVTSKRNVSMAVSETPPDTDTDTDTDKKKLYKEKVEFTNSLFHNIPTELLSKWESSYPAIDIKNEITKAEAWVLANPKLKKSNWGRFLNNWMTRAQDRARSGGNGSKQPISPKTYAQAKDAEKRALFATYNAQKEGSHGNAENNPDGDNKIAGRLPLPGPVS